MDETVRRAADLKARDFLDGLWRQGDFWDLESSGYEQDKFARQLEVLKGGPYERVLEIGCGAGHFTRMLAPVAERVVAIDIAPSAIARARERAGEHRGIEFRVANVMEFDLRADGPWDLVVMSETICYLGWLYPLFDVGWLASEIYDTTREGGRLLMANTYGDGRHFTLQRPWLIRTYRDLFVNVGYRIETEEVFHGVKDSVSLDALISLFAR